MAVVTDVIKQASLQAYSPSSSSVSFIYLRLYSLEAKEQLVNKCCIPVNLHISLLKLNLIVFFWRALSATQQASQVKLKSLHF